MPANYTGSPTAITPHEAPVIACPVDADPANAALFNAPYQKLADVIAFLQQYAPIMGAANVGNLELTGALDIIGQATIGSNLSVGGDANIDGHTNSAAPSSATDYKLVSEHPGFGSGAGSVRRYAYGAGGTLALIETLNAYNSAGTWFRDVAGQPAYALRLTEAGLRLQVWPVGDATAFARELKTAEAGLKWLGTGTGAADANPPAAEAISNELRAKNIAKAMASVLVTDGVAAVRGESGFNVTSVERTSVNEITVTLAGEMADGNYAVIGCMAGPGSGGTEGGGLFWNGAHSAGKTAGAFVLTFHLGSAPGFNADISGLTFGFDFVVHGRQNS